MNDVPDGTRREDVAGLDPDTIPWPSDTDTVLPTGLIDPAVSADLMWLRYWAGGTATFHALGFREAAELLAPRVGYGPGQEDALVYPFAYCWRHHLELRLKMLIAEAAGYLDEALPAKVRKDLSRSHDLAKLWGYCRPLLERVDQRDSSALANENIERLLTELNWLDPHPGIAFRYPTATDGSTPTLGGIDHLDVESFHKACLGLSNALSGWSDMIVEWRSAAPSGAELGTL